MALAGELNVPAPDSPTDGRLTLLVCHIDDGGPPPHACKRAQRALRAAGHDFDKIVAAKGIPFALFTSGRRPKLKQLTGQEQLPVLRLPDGTTIIGATRHHRLGQSQRPSHRTPRPPPRPGLPGSKPPKQARPADAQPGWSRMHRHGSRTSCNHEPINDQRRTPCRGMAGQPGPQSV